MYNMNVIWLISIVKKPLLSKHQTEFAIVVLDYFLEKCTVVD